MAACLPAAPLTPAPLTRCKTGAERFGWEIATSIKLLGQQAEREAPSLQHYSAWGARTDTGAASLAP